MTVFLLDTWCTVPYYTSRLYKGLIKQKADVVMASMTYDLDPFCFQREGIQNSPGCLDLVGKRRLRHPFIRRILKLTEGCINLVALAARSLLWPPDVIHIHSVHWFGKRSPLEWWFLRYAQALKIKLVFTVHNLLPHDTGNRYQAGLARLYRTVDALICHSEDAKVRLVREFGLDQNKVWIIPHGPLFQESRKALNHNERSASAWCYSGECLVVFQGMIRPYKGVPFLLNAWREVERAGCKARLVIAGLADKAYEKELRNKSQELGLKSVIFEFEFLPLSDMLSLLQVAEVLVYPYREITTSGALMTGVVQQKAIVATDLLPFKGLLQNQENALLVPYGNTEALASALIHLIKNPGERQRLVKALAKTTMENDPWANIAHDTIQCYQSVVKNGLSQDLRTLPN